MKKLFYAIFSLTVAATLPSWSADSAHTGDHGSSKDWSHKRHDQVRKIFPHQEKTEGLSVRPQKTQLLEPAFLAKINGTSVVLKWEADKKATHYHVQVSKDAGFNNRSMYVFENKLFEGSQVEIKDLEPNTHYFWRVSVINNNQAQQFTKSVFNSSAFITE